MMMAPFVDLDRRRWQGVARLIGFGRVLSVRQAFKDFAT
jgi:hypothetical protein